MSVLNGEPDKISWKISIPLILVLLSFVIFVWVAPKDGYYFNTFPSVDLTLKILFTILSPIGSLMVLAWTKFKEEK